MNERDRTGAEWLDAFRREERLSPQRAERLLQAVKEKQAAGVGPSARVEVTSPPPLPVARAGWSGAKLWLAIVTVALPLVVVVQQQAARPHERNAPTVLARGNFETTPRVQPLALEEHAAEPIAKGAEEGPSVPEEERRRATKRPVKRNRRSDATVPPSRPSPAPSATPEDRASDTIDAEVAGLAMANRQLQSGAPRAALDALDQMERTFGRGALSDARALTRILATCAAGDRDGARALAQSFLREHPLSPYASRVAGACRRD